jgi:hypothetical protein
MEAQARQVANTVTYLNRHNRTSIGNKELKINIVLQNRTIEPNGFVALSPFRSVFQITPPADNFSLGSENWIQLLSLHEYRHALQNMNFRSGIGKTFYRVFGENGQAFITNLLIPDWFWEGDAVFMETALSNQGRGRLPSFLEPFKSLYYAGKDYDYAKIRNGSLRDMVPNDYPLGYMMSAYGRDTLGIYFWELATQEALLNHKLTEVINNKFPEHPYQPFRYGLYPLASSLHYLTGTKIRGFYGRALHHFSTQWKAEREKLQVTPVDTLKSNTTKSLLNYRYPHVLPGGDFLAIKYGYAVTPRIIRIDSTGKEHTVVRIGDSQDDYYAYAGGKILWTERRPNARWGWVDYSILRMYDTRTHKTTTLSHKTRYFSPSLSPDGSRIVVVEVSAHEHSRLLILDATTGKPLDTLSNPADYFYTYPVFSPDGKAVIAAVRDSSGRMALLRQFPGNGAASLLSPFYHHPLGPPTVTEQYIFFPAAFTHNVQLYALRKQDRKLFRIASRPLGDYSVCVDFSRHRFLFDEYTAKGYQLASLEVNPSAWKPIDQDTLRQIRDPYVPKALHTEGGSIVNKITDHDYPVSRYRQIKHLIYPHGLYFLASYPNIGLFTQSQDILNTLQLSAGAAYNFNEKSPSVSFNALYGGWFPVIEFGIAKSFSRNTYTTQNTVLTWNESNMYAGVSIPLDLSSNLYNRNLSFGAVIHHSGLNYRPSPALKKTSARITYLDESLIFSNGRMTTAQQINPKFGQIITLDYQHSISDVYARQLSGTFNLFFPGLFRNHSLYFTLAFSRKDSRNEYKFSDDFTYVNGYHSVPYRKIYNASVNYQLPLAYPDWGLTWAYLLRVRMHLFFDYSHAEMLPGVIPDQAMFRSVGAAVYLDTRLFSYLSVPLGVRYSYLFDQDFHSPRRKGIIELVIPATIFKQQ